MTYDGPAGRPGDRPDRGTSAFARVLHPCYPPPCGEIRMTSQLLSETLAGAHSVDGILALHRTG
jgi:hypothetical protein